MKCKDCRHTPNTQDCIEAFDCDCAPSSCTSGLHCSLPPLPQPKVLRRVMPNDYRYGDVMGYTARQMKEYAKRAMNEANKQIGCK